MRSLLFASSSLLAVAFAGHAQAQTVPQMLAPGQSWVSTPNPDGGTTYVIQNVDGTHSIIVTTKRGGIRSRRLATGYDMENGFTYSLNGGPTIYRPYDPDLHPVNQVDPKAMKRLSKEAAATTDFPSAGFSSSSHH